MLLQCQKATALLARRGLRPAALLPRVDLDQRRSVAQYRKRVETMIHEKGNFKTTPVLETTEPLAQRILEKHVGEKTNTVGKKRRRSTNKTLSQRALATGSVADTARVNVVSEVLCGEYITPVNSFVSLCGAPDLPKRLTPTNPTAADALSPKIDDILNTLGPSLQRHKGCDLIDIFPGAGLWSQKMHDFLQPRSHIMMEPDIEFYTEFLQPLLDKPNTTVVPKSGIVWDHLNEILTPEYLPHQTEISRDPTIPPERNDTLLVMANFTWYPRRKFGSFQSVSHLLLYQIMSSIRTSSLFQKYGLVRMLIWIDPANKSAILPRSLQKRKRVAMEAEMTTEWLREITQPPEEHSSTYYHRNPEIALESGKRVLERMQATDIPLPPENRQTSLLKTSISGDALSTPDNTRNFYQELEELTARNAQQEFQAKSEDSRRLKQLRYRDASEAKIAATAEAATNEYHKLTADMQKRGRGRLSHKTLADREEVWNARVDDMHHRIQNEVLVHLHETHLLRQEPPAMHWDRRIMEPLVVQKTEFFPNDPACLLDIQPKAPPPQLRLFGSANGYLGDMYELIMRSIMHTPSDKIGVALENCWPGAAEAVADKCPSLKDPKMGGSVVGGHGEIRVRQLNGHQLTEIMETWMKWPFRPTFRQLVARIGDDTQKRTSYEQIGEPSDGVQILM